MAVYLVGAGPGASDLITVRGAKLLAQADCVLYDALVSDEMLDLLPRHAIKISVGKRCGQPSLTQQEINTQLVAAANQYATVVRLKGGDPLLFGRADEEISALQAANIAFEIVPGVTSALAASADLKTPLTKRGLTRAVKFITPTTGHGEAVNTWVDGCHPADTLVFYMGKRHAQDIAKALLAKHFSSQTPVRVVANASYINVAMQSTTLNDLLTASLQASDAPCLIFVGWVYAPNMVQS